MCYILFPFVCLTLGGLANIDWHWALFGLCLQCGNDMCLWLYACICNMHTSQYKPTCLDVNIKSIRFRSDFLYSNYKLLKHKHITWFVWFTNWWTENSSNLWFSSVSEYIVSKWFKKWNIFMSHFRIRLIGALSIIRFCINGAFPCVFLSVMVFHFLGTCLIPCMLCS